MVACSPLASWYSYYSVKCQPHTHTHKQNHKGLAGCRGIHYRPTGDLSATTINLVGRRVVTLCASEWEMGRDSRTGLNIHLSGWPPLIATHTLRHKYHLRTHDFKGSTDREGKPLTFPISADHIAFSEMAERLDLLVLLLLSDTFAFWVMAVGQVSIKRTGFRTPDVPYEDLNKQTEGLENWAELSKEPKRPICVRAKHHVTPAVSPWLSSIQG